MFRFDYEQITEIMQSFHLITGVQVAIFDAEFREVATYPEENCEFCRVMKSCPKTRRKCNYADRRSMSECQKKNGLVIYKCHAGLCEAVVPLHENEQIVGYMMLGQITDSTDRTALLRGAEELADKYGFDADELKKAVGEITYKNESEIAAAAKIMEACTSYILLKELITPEHSRLLDAAKEYIEKNLSSVIDIARMCEELSVGRTRLYEIFKKEAGMGIAKYINRRRMHRAKKLLKTSEMTIPEIAEAVGFTDYNYFSRVYKKTYGKSPRYYR